MKKKVKKGKRKITKKKKKEGKGRRKEIKEKRKLKKVYFHKKRTKINRGLIEVANKR